MTPIGYRTYAYTDLPNIPFLNHIRRGE
jgi:hypothetical protein